MIIWVCIVIIWLCLLIIMLCSDHLGVFSDSLVVFSDYLGVLSDIGELMIEQFTKKPRARRRMFLTDPWSCFCCASILVDPVSVACGHTACKQCLSKVSS